MAAVGHADEVLDGGSGGDGTRKGRHYISTAKYRIRNVVAPLAGAIDALATVMNDNATVMSD